MDEAPISSTGNVYPSMVNCSISFGELPVVNLLEEATAPDLSVPNETWAVLEASQMPGKLSGVD